MDPKLIVHTDPEILSGTPVFVGTRVPVQALLDYLEAEQAVAFFEEAGRALIAEIA